MQGPFPAYRRLLFLDCPSEAKEIEDVYALGDKLLESLKS